MATYKVKSDGNAPKGLKKGDSVVTGGGTYKITGVNGDGSYKSTRVSDTTTSNYTGSYATPPSSSSITPKGTGGPTVVTGGGTVKYVGGGGSSGGGGGSYGGSSTSTKNSQYTKPTLGNTWDANTDYSDVIDKAVANGDYVTAAKAEQLRNQKIIATNSPYAQTNRFGGWLDNTDYSDQAWTGVSNGISADEMQAIYNGRYDKASGTEGMEQYLNDETMQMMLQYIKDHRQLEEYQSFLENYERENLREDYQNQYDPQIDAILAQILNRDDFSYDAMNDPLYQQYAQMYQREGDRAMRETMAEAAAGAGGMNTYAMTAAQQANNYYNSQLMDRIPQLYQLAYDMYINDKESKVQDLGILQNMDATQYNRYRDTINDYYNDKNFAYGVYQDAVQQGNWQKNFNYNSAWDNKLFENDNYWAEKNFNANQADKEYDKDIYNKETAEARANELIQYGELPGDDILAQAGMDKAYALQLVNAVRRKLGLPAISTGSTAGNATVTSGGGSKSNGSNKSYTPTVYDDYKPTEPEPGNPTGGVKDVSDTQKLNLGIGPVSDEKLGQLTESGAVVVKNDGTAQWANGYNASNYQEALNKLYTQGRYSGVVFPW